jgi:anti-anti-sigma factor
VGAEAAVAVIAGEVDATNAGTLLDYVLRKAVLCRGLVLDLTAVTFFSSAGYTSLRTLDTRCATAGIKWTVVPSREVRRVIAICDVPQQLPISGTLARALLAVSTGSD